MNSFRKKPRGELELCPKCGMDSGERKCSVNLPEKYYVRCGSCGFIVSGNTQSSATNRWNAMTRVKRERGMRG